ncbi:hypothetical protein KM043_004460 [Ampulex compressa]|nr:hypothetical protein KM043_004460 [Ampulex compressa]
MPPPVVGGRWRCLAAAVVVVVVVVVRMEPDGETGIPTAVAVGIPRERLFCEAFARNRAVSDMKVPPRDGRRPCFAQPYVSDISSVLLKILGKVP